MKKTLISLFVIGLIVTIVCGIGVVNQFQVESKKSKEVTENYHKAYDENKVKNLNIDLNNSNLKLKKGDQLKVESRGSNDKINMDTTIKNGTLYVKDKPLDSNVDITFMDFKNNDVIITLPKSLSHLNVNTESGSIMIDQIKADYAKLYADVGELNISHAKFDRLIAEVDVADMYVTKTQFNSGEFEGDTGSIDIKDMPIDKTVKVKTDVGDITMDYTDKQPNNTRIEFDSDVGELDINNHLFKNKQVGNGSNLIHIKTDTGDAEIN
ncbi:DUF4097 domain-containing protein [Staphylococcus cohnii]|uniref:DUF4097 family beta strand repeat-containing protein n=1 Tax=Staphylococcus cohnii TaxID=29382 RepID=UPI001CCBE097|nr:DUF4097 family beta strand repeat-containing protein [Staphylococcus cohnii]MBZ8172391.1 DUF4097 domain-containing protein [Staphylococcus cohnii]